MLLRSYSKIGGPVGSFPKRRGLPILKATAQPISLPFSSSSSSTTSPSYRAITTAPTFTPATTPGPQYDPGPPQLLGRRLTLNPLHGLVAWLGPAEQGGLL
ncbi:hypothetical protein Agub_g5999, partial [Astrephomene gubernaculifera]